jgi:DNA-binding transcriptional regulator YdaS (Cro superfamily)
MKLELKIELIRRFGSQIVAARHLGIGESRLSHIVRGHAEPSVKEREALERALGPSVAKKGVETIDHVAGKRLHDRMLSEWISRTSSKS